MSDYLVRQPRGFGPGYTAVTRIDEPRADTGIDFGVLRLAAGQRYDAPAGLETAALLLQGEVRFALPGAALSAARGSIFEQQPLALHADASTAVQLEAAADSELALLQVRNEGGRFEARLFDGESMVQDEHRGRGSLDDTAYRMVRTIFDGRNRPTANLVLGEVINFPGRWSSYPPHHHPQPELYHYRFTEPQGFGHAELGEVVLKVRQHDTVKILDQLDHSQVAAPGYGMYYIWAIRHLPGCRYTVPEFAEEHRWLLEPGQRPRSPDKAKVTPRRRR